MDENTALTYAITKALAYQENGGKPTSPKAGASGELKSIFQFEPGTWVKDSQEILGKSNIPITPDNETKVVTGMVSKWIDKGYSVKQMASMWNAGVGEPDAYTGKFSDGSPSTGKNSYGVKYNVPAYANSVANYAKQFYTQDFAPQVKQATANTTQPPVATAQQPTVQPSQPGSGGSPGLLTPSAPPIS